MREIGSSLAGIRVGQQRAEVAAGNIARASVRDHKAHELVTTATPDGVQANVRTTEDSVELAEAAVELLRAEQEVEFNARALKRRHEGEASDLFTLGRDDR